MIGLTDSQHRAATASGDVLVPAGAGAGKTRTLVERCVTWLLANARHSVRELLVVTFTEAAAAEMRRRLRQELEIRLAGATDPELRLRLVGEIALLDEARIGTLHSFCLELVRQHFYELEIDPQSAVLSKEEARRLEDEVFTSLFDRHYALAGPDSAAVLELLARVAAGREGDLRETVRRLHHFSRSLPDPEAWLAGQEEHFSAPRAEVWKDWLRAALWRWREEWLPELEPFADVPAVRDGLAALRRFGPDSEWPVFEESLNIVVAANTDKKLWPRGTATRTREQVGSFFKEAMFLHPLVPGAAVGEIPAGLQEDWEWSRPHLRTLVRLTREFGREFSREKRERGVLDFQDQEHFALRLLTDGARSTPLAAALRATIKQVLVDEYQDINAVQDAILRAVSGEGAAGNRFLVGDVKQSIYRFRLADPRIFQRYCREWSAAGTVIPLSENFRSHEAILEFVNVLFAQLMRPEIGGVHFDDTARLVFGDRAGRAALTWSGERAAGAPDFPSARVELLLRITTRPRPDVNEDEEEFEDASQAEREARLIAHQLRRLVADGTPIHDGGGFRPLRWGDIVLLLRSPRGKAESYAKEFAAAGIPFAAERGGFFDRPAIRDVLSLLALLDNPLQDIPTVAVLRSPLVGLSLDELASVRLAAPGRFWKALQTWVEQPESGTHERTDASSTLPDANGTRKKLRRFLNDYARWRRLAQTGSVADCLDAILRDTGYDLRSPPGTTPQEHRAHLARLRAEAARFDAGPRPGLHRFLGLLQARADSEADDEPSTLPAGDAVRLMSIHKSKGLEFPVVVLADLGKRFNMDDLRERVIWDEAHGLAAHVLPPPARPSYPSLAHWLVARGQRRELVGEELRILYVALTRACQRLILVGSASEKTVREKWPQKAALTRRWLLESSNALSWIGAWLPQVTGRIDWADEPRGASRLVRWERVSEDDPRLAPPAPMLLESPSQAAIPAADRERRTREWADWRYPHSQATTTTAKETVSALRAKWPGDRGPNETARFRESSDPVRFDLSARAAGRGTAHHVLLQMIPLADVDSQESLAAGARVLEERGILTPEERSTLDLGAVGDFWRSEVGRAILAHRDRVQREMPFTLRLSVTEMPALSGQHASQNEQPADPGEFVVLQGVVDLAVLLDREIWLLDFKTDAVSQQTCAARAETYRVQIDLYARALERIHRRPVTRRWLHFLSARTTVEMPQAALPL